MKHPHNAHRGVHLQRKKGKAEGTAGEEEGEEPAPAPRLSRTPANPEKIGDVVPGYHSKEILSRTFNFSASEIEQLLSTGVIIDSSSSSTLPLRSSL